jgi:hypothetical protein
VAQAPEACKSTRRTGPCGPYVPSSAPPLINTSKPWTLHAPTVAHPPLNKPYERSFLGQSLTLNHNKEHQDTASSRNSLGEWALQHRQRPQHSRTKTSLLFFLSETCVFSVWIVSCTEYCLLDSNFEAVSPLLDLVAFPTSRAITTHYDRHLSLSFVVIAVENLLAAFHDRSPQGSCVAAAFSTHSNKTPILPTGKHLSWMHSSRT